MGFALGFINGAANEANRERDANTASQNEYLANSMDWFDKQVMPAYRKQQTDAQAVTDRYNTYAAYAGPDGLKVDPSIAAQAATDGKDHDPLDLVNQTRQTIAMKARQSASTPPQGQQQQPDQAAQPAQPQQPQQGPFQPNAGPSAQPQAQQAPMQAAPNAQTPQQVQPQGQPMAAPQAPVQQMPPQGQQPVAPQQAQPAMQQQTQGQAAPQQQNVDPQQQQFHQERSIMNSIGALLTGQVGTEQQRQQFLQQASAKYGMDEGQIRQLIRQYNNPQSVKPVPQPGSVVATPTLAQNISAANTFSSPDATRQLMGGDLVGATASQQKADDADYDSVRQDTLDDKKTASGLTLSNEKAMSDYNFAHQQQLQTMKDAQGKMDPHTIDTVADKIKNYQMAPPSPYSIGRDPDYWTAVLDKVGPDYDSRNFAMSQKALNNFGTGEQGNQVRAFNVAIQHLDVLKNAYGALQNGDVKMANHYANEYANQTGEAAPNTVNAVSRLVGQELTKAVVGTRNGVQEREEAGKTVSSDLSNMQIGDVINKYQDLMGGQMNGLRQQYESATMRNDFDHLLLPRTRQIMADHGYLNGGQQSQGQTPQIVTPSPDQLKQIGTIPKGKGVQLPDGSKWANDANGQPYRLQ